MRYAPAIALLAVGCATSNGPSITAARDELLGAVSDVPAATAYRYQVIDDRGVAMGPVKIIQGPQPGVYAAIYHWSNGSGPFTVALATSANLLDWTWQVDLGFDGSQPTIAATDDGGYVVAWEQGITDDIHVRFNYYATWEALLDGQTTKTFDAARQLPGCGEGTPNIYAATSTRVDFGLHYYRGCQVDRQARGAMDWTKWEAEEETLLDRAIAMQGYRGHFGDRDMVEFEGHEFLFVEGQFDVDDWDDWQIFEYDADTGAADRASYPEFAPEPASEHVFIRTHQGSHSFTNISVSAVQIDGHDAIVVGLFVQRGPPAEEGELIYYRILDE
jgi:hypothetical protein